MVDPLTCKVVRWTASLMVPSPHSSLCSVRESSNILYFYIVPHGGLPARPDPLTVRTALEVFIDHGLASARIHDSYPCGEVLGHASWSLQQSSLIVV